MAKAFLEGFTTCVYPVLGVPAADADDAKAAFVMQHLMWADRCLVVGDHLGHIALALKRARGCDVHTEPDGFPFDMVVSYDPDPDWPIDRLARQASSGPGGHMLVWRSAAPVVRSEVERFILNNSVENWYLHVGSGLYVLRSLDWYRSAVITVQEIATCSPPKDSSSAPADSSSAP